MARKRKGEKHACGLYEASWVESADATLARAAAAGEAPQESSEEEALVADAEVEEETPKASAEPAAAPASAKMRLQKKRRRLGAECSASAGALREGGGGDPSRVAAWAESGAKLDRWMTSRGGGLGSVLEESKGKLVKLRDYFPGDVADAALAALEALPESAWKLSERSSEEGVPGHRFWSSDITDLPALAPLRSVFWRLLKTFRGEPTLPIFSACRHGASDFSGRHDGRAHVPFFQDDNVYSRTVGGVWHLSREWSEQEGGSLVDLEAPGDEAGAGPVPLFNSLAVFEVPHMHEVTAVTAGRHRYSICGWWHQQGKRYEVPDAVAECGDEAARPAGAKKKAQRRREAPVEAEAGGETSASVATPAASAAPAAPAPRRKKKRAKSSPPAP